MSAAEGPGPGRAAGVRVPPARRRQAHRGGVEGKEPAQDGHHRHVRCGVAIDIFFYKQESVFLILCI